jgi:hypothetical protein
MATRISISDGPPASHNARQCLRLLILFTSLALSLWNASLGTTFLHVQQQQQQQQGLLAATTTILLPQSLSSDDSGGGGRSNRNDHHHDHHDHHNNDENDDLDRLMSQGTAMALRLATNDLPPTAAYTATVATNHQATTTTTTTTMAAAAEWEIDIHQLIDGRCDVVYSFGVGNDDPWTNLMARYCRRVYAFDPTVSSYANPNVTFYPWGLWHGRSSYTNGATTGDNNNNNTAATSWSHPVYGSAVPEAEYLTFPQVQARLLASTTWSSSSSSQDDPKQHPHRRLPDVITALKFDCEGCEYAAFRAGHIPSTQKLYTEFHFATTLGMRDQQDVASIVAVQQYLDEHHCTVDRFRPNRGFRRDRTVLPYLVERGVPNGTCCYEYIFTCHRPNNNNHNNNAGMVVG